MNKKPEANASVSRRNFIRVSGAGAAVLTADRAFSFGSVPERFPTEEHEVVIIG
ncbi:MAG: twin-arginine translocation signal domain-containing protein, partial [Proteobacteria bacterium]